MDRVGGGGGGGKNPNSKTLFDKDCSLGSARNLSNKLVLAKLLINTYQITGILYIYIYA